MADGNPYIKGHVEEDFFVDRLSDELGNSTNHRLRPRGQNVLFQDGHVESKPTPGVGLYGQVDPALGGFGFDNIYTVYETIEPTFIDPGSASPTNVWCNLGGRSDACLVP
jgi:prepilin-type processing-associated H-X9-DG protein